MAVSYDYRCKDCELAFEVRHSMTETPIVICPRCKSRSTHKVPSLVGLVTRSGRSVSMDRAKDQVKRNIEMKDEMRRDIGIEKIHPLRSSTMEEIYRDTKTQASFIKEKMAQQAEKRRKETEAKRKEWTRRALARTPQRAKERMARRAKAEAAKRKIVL